MAVIDQVEKTEEVAFDPKAFNEARNKGEAYKPAPTAAEPAAAKPAEEPEAPRLPRSARREMNRMREEIGALRAKLEMGAKPAEVVAQPKEEAEPQRKDFASDGEYLRATQKWDKAQEAKQTQAKTGDTAKLEEYQAHIKEMDNKAAEDITKLEDWDEVAKNAAADEDAPEIDWLAKENETLLAMFLQSDVRAYVMYHLAKHPDVAEKLYSLSANPGEQIRFFHRLEGRMEKEYDSTHKAAQATEKAPKDRTHPAEAAKPGGTAAGAIPAKPKPSSEVAARGGSSAPEEPAIGSPAWMLMRNQAQYGR